MRGVTGRRTLTPTLSLQGEGERCTLKFRCELRLEGCKSTVSELEEVSPRTWIEYSAALRWELALSSSAVSRRRAARSWMFAVIG